MKQIEPGTIDLVFADPPFNIGYEYDEYHDEKRHRRIRRLEPQLGSPKCTAC